MLLFYHNPESEANDESAKLTDNLEMSRAMIIQGALFGAEKCIIK